MPRVALIDDDERARRALGPALGELGHDVEVVPTGLAGLGRIVDAAPDAVVLDLDLPDVEGLELIRMIRAVSDVPVLVVTARDADPEVVRALDAGADDHVVKPVSPPQLDARLRAVLRRATADGRDAQLAVGGLRIDVPARTATLDGVPLELARKEFDLLAHLAARPDTVVSKQELLAEVWDQPCGGPDKTVDVHLSWLRRKLGETAVAPRYLRAVRGVGVKLVAPRPDATR